MDSEGIYCHPIFPQKYREISGCNQIIQMISRIFFQMRVSLVLWLIAKADGKVSSKTDNRFAAIVFLQILKMFHYIFFQNDRQSITGIYLFDGYFAKIDAIAKDKKYPARVRYLLQHLIDLRKNNWKPLVQEIHGGYEISMLKLSNVVHVQET